LEKEVGGKLSCKIIVGLLSIAAKHDCEEILSEVVCSQIEKNTLPNLDKLKIRFGEKNKHKVLVDVEVRQHKLCDYDDLLIEGRQAND
jgi:hypothetical protein